MARQSGAHRARPAASSGRGRGGKGSAKSSDFLELSSAFPFAFLRDPDASLLLKERTAEAIGGGAFSVVERGTTFVVVGSESGGCTSCGEDAAESCGGEESSCVGSGGEESSEACRSSIFSEAGEAPEQRCAGALAEEAAAANKGAAAQSAAAR